MSTKQKLDPEVIWLMSFIGVPLIALRAVVQNALPDPDAFDTGIQATVVAAVGAGIGAGIYAATRKKTRLIRGIALGLVILACFLPAIWLRPSSDADPEAESTWQEQDLHLLSFASPTPLVLTDNRIPATAGPFFDTLLTYSDTGKDRFIVMQYARMRMESHLSDTLLRESIRRSLPGRKNEATDLNIAPPHPVEGGLAATYTFRFHEKPLQGYCFMYQQGRRLQSVSLVPVNRSFSDAFLKKFEAELIVME